ncbi:DUF3618 domain-containing protein [Actinophytocola sp.]|uniref:DUF3618 domain-containing protein n=1 Tax=Actinophytocola sp. TaxID=1872138 RepID=UPI00389A9C23
MTDEQERLTMPGQAPTDEDLRMDAELTRQELAQTVAALGEKVDIKARAHDKGEALRERGDELTDKLPEQIRPVAAPVVTTATRRPALSLAVLLALVLVLRRVFRSKNSD